MLVGFGFQRLPRLLCAVEQILGHRAIEREQVLDLDFVPKRAAHREADFHESRRIVPIPAAVDLLHKGR